jgi:hypothetical protein
MGERLRQKSSEQGDNGYSSEGVRSRQKKNSARFRVVQVRVLTILCLRETAKPMVANRI